MSARPQTRTSVQAAAPLYHFRNMRIDQLLSKRQEPSFSFEFFPPKTPEGEQNLFETVESLRDLEPDLRVGHLRRGRRHARARPSTSSSGSRTSSASRRWRTSPASAHTREELHDVLDEMRDAGIENIIALRGDPPEGRDRVRAACPAGSRYAVELAALISRVDYDFCIARRLLPGDAPRRARRRDGPDATSSYKVDAGASFLITQLFFDNDDYFDFVDRARASGIDVPIIAGHHADHQLRADQALHEHVRRDDPARASTSSSRRAPRTARRRSPSSASPTRRCSAPTCSRAARPASTSTR